MSDQPPPAAPTPPPGDPEPAAPPTGSPGVSPGHPTGPGGPEPGWVPPAGGHPPGAAPYGGQPWYPGLPAAYPGLPAAYPGPPAAYPGPPAYGWYQPPGHGFDPNDALVTPPGAGLGGWFARCTGAVRRGWRLLLPILLLTQVLPAAVLSVLMLAIDPSAEWEAAATDDAAPLPDTFLTDLATILGVAIGGSLLFGLLQSLGWAAGTWVVARQAAGEPVSLGAALRYGLRRALGLWGWTLLISVIIGIGLCFCLVPGIYLAFALSMAGPVYLFERGNPVGRAWRMFHDRLGLLAGRVALVAAAVIVGSLLAGMVEGIGMVPFGATPLASPGSAVGAIAVILVAAVLAAPAYLAQLVGLVVTYAEQRAHEGPVTGGQLAAELG